MAFRFIALAAAVTALGCSKPIPDAMAEEILRDQAGVPATCVYRPSATITRDARPSTELNPGDHVRVTWPPEKWAAERACAQALGMPTDTVVPGDVWFDAAGITEDGKGLRVKCGAVVFDQLVSLSSEGDGRVRARYKRKLVPAKDYAKYASCVERESFEPEGESILQRSADGAWTVAPRASR